MVPRSCYIQPLVLMSFYILDSADNYHCTDSVLDSGFVLADRTVRVSAKSAETRGQILGFCECKFLR